MAGKASAKAKKKAQENLSPGLLTITVVVIMAGSILLATLHLPTGTKPWLNMAYRTHELRRPRHSGQYGYIVITQNNRAFFHDH